jgi:hypothetical protein
MDRMPLPGDLITAFSVQQGRCFRMVYSDQLRDPLLRAASMEGPVEGRQGKDLVRRGVPMACAEGGEGTAGLNPAGD